MSSGTYGLTGGETISVGVSDSDGDWANIGCLVGTTRVSARSVSTSTVTCVAPARAEDDIANVPIMVGVRYAEQSASVVTRSTDVTTYSGGTPKPTSPYELLNDELFLFGRGKQVMQVSSEEDFTCVLTTVVDNVTSVFKSTTANASPFDQILNCLLPLNVEVGFVAMGITGGKLSLIHI